MTSKRSWQEQDPGRSVTRQPVVLNVPGLGNSGPGHWQTRWEARYPWMRRAELGQWDRPDRLLWTQRLDAAIRHTDGPVILVAHSLGCLAVAWWAAQHRPPYRRTVAAALLVAPADADLKPTHPAIAQFAPVPLLPLPFPSILVASRNDPCAAFDRARKIAAHWGSHLVDAGDAGHINADSGLGDWPIGITLLDRLIDTGQLRVEADSQLAKTARFLSRPAGDHAPMDRPW